MTDLTAPQTAEAWHSLVARLHATGRQQCQAAHGEIETTAYEEGLYACRTRNHDALLNRGRREGAAWALGLARSVPTEMARLEIQADGLVVRAVDGDQEAAMTVAAELLAGVPGRIALNRRYLAEATAALDAEAVVLAMSGPARPVLLTADGDEAGLQVVMPMHVER